MNPVRLLPGEQWPGSEVIKLFSYSTQLRTKLIMLINVKMPTIVGILTFISMINTTSERLKARNFFICRYFSFYEQLKFRAQLSWAWKKGFFLTSGPGSILFAVYAGQEQGKGWYLFMKLSLKLEQVGFATWWNVIGSDWMTFSVDPDQNSPSDAVWQSGKRRRKLKVDHITIKKE